MHKTSQATLKSSCDLFVAIETMHGIGVSSIPIVTDRNGGSAEYVGMLTEKAM